MPSDIENLERALLTAKQMPDQAAPLPANEPSLDEAYALQRRMLDGESQPIAAWKLGLTSEVSREAFGSAEPASGRLPASGLFKDGSEIAFCGHEMYAEAELVFEMGEDLPAQDQPYTHADVCAALKGIYAGIEIVRTRFTSSNLTLPLLVADNVMAHGLVVGRKLSDRWEDRFADMPVTLTRGDEETTGSTARVMGNPLDALVWLANWLRKNEQSNLKRGQFIASGTCTGATKIFAGDTIHVNFDGVEGARVTLRNAD